MAILTIDMRSGRTDEQKRRFAAAILDAVNRATGEPRENVHLIIHENLGINLVENGQHLPEIAKPVHEQ
ncbi:tautomerase family protein [Lysobacter sp. P5_B9]